MTRSLWLVVAVTIVGCSSSSPDAEPKVNSSPDAEPKVKAESQPQPDQQERIVSVLGLIQNWKSVSFEGPDSKGPSLTAEEIEAVRNGPILAKELIDDNGIAVGFPAAAKELAIKYPGSKHLDLFVIGDLKIAEVTKILGPEVAKESGTIPNSEGRELKLTWHKYGWLSIGVVETEVRVIRADCSSTEKDSN
jgi:hypothetical protein